MCLLSSIKAMAAIGLNRSQTQGWPRLGVLLLCCLCLSFKLAQQWQQKSGEGMLVLQEVAPEHQRHLETELTSGTKELRGSSALHTPATVAVAAVMVTKDVPAPVIKAFHANAADFNRAHGQDGLQVELLFFVGMGGHPMMTQRLAHDVTRMNGSIVSSTYNSSKSLPRFVVSNYKENMNEGKTYEWLSYATTYFPSSQWVFKIDTDAAINWVKLLTILTNTSDEWRYFGSIVTYRTCGGFLDCPPRGCIDFSCKCWVYMQGGFYGMSTGVAKAIAQCEFAKANTIGPEDVVTGKMIKMCIANGKAVQLIHFPYQQKPWCHNKKVNVTQIRRGDVVGC